MNILSDGHFFWCHKGNRVCPSLEVLCLCKLLGYTIILAIAVLVSWIEIGGAHDSGSLALFGDGLHVGSDALIYPVMIAAVIAKLLHKNGAIADIESIDNRWGHRIANILIAVGIVMSLSGIIRLMVDPTPEIEPYSMLRASVWGLFGNIVMYIIMHGLKLQHAGHGDSHGHDHEDKVHKGAFKHLGYDTFGSVVVTGSALAIIISNNPKITIMEPIASVIVGILIFFAGREIKKEIEKRKN